MALFVFLTDNVLGWVNVGFHSAAANFVIILVLAMYLSSRSPYCIVSSHKRVKTTVQRIEANREYLQDAKATMGAYNTANSSTTVSAQQAGEPPADVRSADNESNVGETSSCCEKHFGPHVAICWSTAMEYFYRVMHHRRRLFVIALR